jgi:hypothetical protein
MSRGAAPAGELAKGKSEGSVSKTVGFMRHREGEFKKFGKFVAAMYDDSVSLLPK